MSVDKSRQGIELTPEQRELFVSLTRDREENANILEKTSMKGVKQSVTDKYSEQAHFIYELLQNADDAKASTVRFILEDHGLFFVHTGKIHFSISDPDSIKEESGKANGTLGHINSITSIAHSTKSEAEIGKFGIGFKSVFQYTNTPHIYDPPFIFKIERFIVPIFLDKDHPNHKNDETLFYFPFDSEKKLPEKAYEEISKRLQALDNPSLFLRHIKEIRWHIASNNSSGSYIKEEVIESDHRRVTMITEVDKDRSNIEYLIFDKELSNNGNKHKISVAYLVEESKISSTHKFPAYCFFATHETTELRFIINAPFLLTDNRENIRRQIEWNKFLIAKAAGIVVESLHQIKDMRLLDTDFLKVLPNNSDELEGFYKPIQDKIVQAMQSSPLVPTYDKGHAPASELLQGPKEIKDVIGNNELPFFTGKELFWAAGVMQNSRADLFMMKDLGIQEWRWHHLLEAARKRFYQFYNFTSNIAWLQQKSDEWMQRFYALLYDAMAYTNKEGAYSAFYPSVWVVVRTQGGEHVIGNNVYFLGDNKSTPIEGLMRVKPEILKGNNKSRIEKACKFLESTGVKEAGEQEEIKLILEKCYRASVQAPIEKLHLQHIKRFISWWEKEKDTSMISKRIP